MLLDRASRATCATLTILISAGIMATACAEGEKAAPVPKEDRAPASGGLWADAPGYDVFLGKEEDPDARVFQSPDFQKLLVLPGKGDQAFLLGLKKKEVTALARAAVTATADGALMAADVQGQPAGALLQSGAELTFQSGGVTVRLTPEPPLIGEVTAEQLRQKKKDYATSAALYKPNGAAVSLLKAVTSKVEITVFFGTWCHFCKKWLPRFLKTMDVAANPNITYRLIGIDEDLTQPEPLLKKFVVTKTPTFVVGIAGQEVGRIVEEPRKSMEEDLARLLLGGR